ncbi:unnamed protein product [Ranitomeya imitator]|uniref:Uncharacterized protein n=1 Tax=Ranitomeya imitator TaxID=111125 RepID=A0ABN9KYT1_9NEOB|nr:unnamed protein product [Ranitomeya imitator]
MPFSTGQAAGSKTPSSASSGCDAQVRGRSDVVSARPLLNVVSARPLLNVSAEDGAAPERGAATTYGQVSVWSILWAIMFLQHFKGQVTKLAVDFDAELRIVRHKKMQLDVQMKMADLRHITLFEELLLLKDFEKREDILQERVSDRIAELDEMREVRGFYAAVRGQRKEVVKLQEKEKGLHAAFQTSLGEGNNLPHFSPKSSRRRSSE